MQVLHLVVVAAVVLQAACSGQELCEVFLKNPFVQYGSDLTVMFKAPFNSSCHKLMNFDTSRVYWTFNKQKIDQSFYRYNATVSSVYIHNLTVTSATLECHFDPYLLGGTIIKTYLPITSPKHVSCLMKMPNKVNCTWERNRNTVHVSWKCLVNEKAIETSKPSCTFDWPENLDDPLKVAVIAVNPYEMTEVVPTEVTYSNLWSILQMDPPKVEMKYEPKSLQVSWQQTQFEKNDDAKCEVRLRELSSNSEPQVLNLNNASLEVFKFTDIKSCTKYRASVRCKLSNAVWSDWSHKEALTGLNVSEVQFHLWRAKSVINKDSRIVHLMWKGVSPWCNAFDEYRLLDSEDLIKSYETDQDHDFISVDQRAHTITLAAYKNQARLNEVSIAVPAATEDVSLPPVGNVRVIVQDGELRVTWERPGRVVEGYLIVWNSTNTNHVWNYTQQTNFTLKGEPYTLYTVALTPVYSDGPGDEIRLHNYTKEGNLTAVALTKIYDASISDRQAKIHWTPIPLTQCCAFVVNYTVFYKSHSEAVTRNVTVGHDQNRVVLTNLQPGTAYDVYLVASSQSSSTRSATHKILTKSYGEAVRTVLILVASGMVSLTLLTVCTLIMQKKYSKIKFPNPQLSSVGSWDTSSKPVINDVLWNNHTEKFFPCHVDGEISSSMLANNLAQERSAGTEITALSKVTAITQQMPPSCNEQTTRPSALTDLQTTGLYILPFAQSPYIKQTPISSPVDSPIFQFSDETETLLKPQQHTSSVFTYVTMDMMSPAKGQNH